MLSVVQKESSKKLKVQKPLIFPGQSSSLKTALLEDFNSRRIVWENDSPSCTRLICSHCLSYWVTNTTSPKVCARQLSYPFIGIIDKTNQSISSRTPSKWKDHQSTMYHLTAVDNGGTSCITKLHQYFPTKKKIESKESSSPSSIEDIYGQTTSPSTSDTSTPPSHHKHKSTQSRLLNTCRGVLPESLITDAIRDGIKFQ